MKNIFIPIFIVSLLLVGCSSTNVEQLVNTEIALQPTPSPEVVEDEKSPPTEAMASPEPAAAPDVINGDVTEFLPPLDVFPGKYDPLEQEGVPGKISKAGLVENWGPEYQQILDEVEWSDGISKLYLPQPDQTDVPIRILVVVERFASIEGSTAFITYDFPSDFRKGIYTGEPIKLGSADEALLATINNPFGDDPSALSVTIIYRYKNMNVIVEGHGTAESVSFKDLEPIALSILQKLEASH